MSNERTAEIYNNMADEYDDIKDIWYGWVFSRLHYFIARFLEKRWDASSSRRCLDVGCGTGFQSILLGLCGYEVTGVDISDELINKARQKKLNDYLARDLFESQYDFVHEYSEEIRKTIARLRGGAPSLPPSYKIGSATKLDFPDKSFDLVNCCGSTLSSIEDYDTAIQEMTRVLRSRGLMILEVENKYNMDLVWPIIDTCLGGIIGYDQEIKISLANLFSYPSRHVRTDFPFSMHNEEVFLPIWLFSPSAFLRTLRSRGLRIMQIQAIHNFTNFIPSIALDRVAPPLWLSKAFNLLAKIEVLTCSSPLFRCLGCSLVVFAEKCEET